MNVSSCKSCGAPIQWVLMQKTGKRNPLDINKKVIVTESGEAVSGYESHFSTCPNAGQHRKSK